MCQYRYIKFHCTCDGQVWFKACTNPTPAPELNIGYSLCLQKSFQSPYAVTFSGICCSCCTLRLQTSGHSIDAHVIISEFNEGIREVLSESTNKEPWVQLHSLADTQWELLVFRSVQSVEDGLAGLRNLSLGEQVIKTKDQTGGGARRENSMSDAETKGLSEGGEGTNNTGRADKMNTTEGVSSSNKTVEDVSQSFNSMYI